MQIEYRLNLEDYLEVNEAHLKNQKFIYFLLWGSSILLVLLGIVSIIYGPDTVGSGIFCLLMGIFINPKFTFFRRFTLKSHWKSHRGLQESMKMELAEDGIIMEAPLFTSHLKWGMYVRWVETKNLFIVYQSSNSFNTFPKRAFASNEDIDEFRAILRENIS